MRWRRRQQLAEASPVASCRQVLEEGAPVTIVLHQWDGTWQMVCSTPNKSEDDIRVLHFGHLVDVDPTLDEARALRRGQGLVRRDPTTPWRTVFFADEEEMDSLFQ